MIESRDIWKTLLRQVWPLYKNFSHHTRALKEIFVSQSVTSHWHIYQCLPAKATVVIFCQSILEKLKGKLFSIIFLQSSYIFTFLIVLWLFKAIERASRYLNIFGKGNILEIPSITIYFYIISVLLLLIIRRFLHRKYVLYVCNHTHNQWRWTNYSLM